MKSSTICYRSTTIDHTIKEKRCVRYLSCNVFRIQTKWIIAIIILQCFQNLDQVDYSTCEIFVPAQSIQARCQRERNNIEQRNCSFIAYTAHQTIENSGIMTLTIVIQFYVVSTMLEEPNKCQVTACITYL